MALTRRGIILVSILCIFFNKSAFAQPQKGKFINGGVGFAVSGPYDDLEIGSSGFYLQGEYVWALKSWFGLRPYAGFITTSPDDDLTSKSFTGYQASSKAVLLGCKTRIAAPIPWFAPFIELGVGASIGSFITHTPFENKSSKGLIHHIPVTLGLALGPKHNVELAFSYYGHPTVRQFSGATAIVLSFPLN